MRDDTSEPGRYHLGDVVGELPGVGGLGPGFEGGGEVHPAVPPAGEHPAGVAEAEELPLRKSFLYGSGNFGSGVWYAFNNFILPGFLDPLHVPAPIIGLLASTRSFEGSVIQPVVGAWSDRTWSRRLGRRRPFIVRFVPISALFVILTAFFPDLVNVGPLGGVARALHIPPTGLVLGLVFAGIFLFTVTFNIMQVGSVPTFLGAAHPILLPPDEVAAQRNGLTPTVVFVEDNASCYLAYALEGGP
jgi:MFS/sugar transport protein